MGSAAQHTFVVSGIGTDVGKTFAAAVLVAGLEAHYWKPIQAGTHGLTDSQWLAQATGCAESKVLPERYLLDAPESPHSAAEKQGVFIDTDELSLPQVAGTLIVEGAGGVMVPLNDDELFIDLMRDWMKPVVLVVDLYLGCINHTLLTLEALSLRNIPIKGLLLNRHENESARQYLTNYSGATVLGFLPEMTDPSPARYKEFFRQYVSW